MLLFVEYLTIATILFLKKFCTDFSSKRIHKLALYCKNLLQLMLQICHMLSDLSQKQKKNKSKMPGAYRNIAHALAKNERTNLFQSNSVNGR